MSRTTHNHLRHIKYLFVYISMVITHILPFASTPIKCMPSFIVLNSVFLSGELSILLDHVLIADNHQVRVLTRSRSKALSIFPGKKVMIIQLSMKFYAYKCVSDGQQVDFMNSRLVITFFYMEKYPLSPLFNLLEVGSKLFCFCPSLFLSFL